MTALSNGFHYHLPVLFALGVHLLAGRPTVGGDGGNLHMSLGIRPRPLLHAIVLSILPSCISFICCS